MNFISKFYYDIYIENARSSCCITLPTPIPPPEPEPEPDINFDITASNWGDVLVTDGDSFVSFLEGLGATGISVNDFSLVAGRLKCFLECTLANMGLSNIEADVLDITEINIMNVEGVVQLKAQYGSIAEFDPEEALSDTLTTLGLEYNSITDFDPSIALPSGLKNLYLSSNSITDFDPSIALPDYLEELYLGDNSLTDFDPSIALPAGLIKLILSENSITGFDPSITLPNTLVQLDIDNNDLTDFDPSFYLPDALTHLALNNNAITEFNPTLALPTGLLNLNLSHNLLEEFDPSIPLPEGIETLNLSNNKLSSADITTVLSYWNTTVEKEAPFTLDLRSQSPTAGLSGAGIKHYTELTNRGCTILVDATSEINFDVTANWESASESITDVDSFISKLLLAQTGVTGAYVTNFSLVSGRLKANIYLEGSLSGFTFGGYVVSTFRQVAIEGITALWVIDGTMTSFNPEAALPSTLIELNLSGNNITSFSPTIPLPLSVMNVYFNNNNFNSSSVNTVLAYFNIVQVKGAGFELDISNQQTPAPPTGSGIDWKDELIGRGAYITTD